MRRGLRLLALTAFSFSWCSGDSGQCELTPDKACKLKVGIVGGGTSLFTIVHNISIHLGGTRRIAAGATHAKPEKALETAKRAGITGYKSWKDMLDAWRKGDQDLDYVAILSRTRDHYEPTKAFLEAGIPVFCEKPMTMSVVQAEEIHKAAASKNTPFLVGHWYTGHPMLMLARELVQQGLIGEVRKIESWFNQDWAVENPSYSWRFDPAFSGMAGAAADVGMHSYSTATWVSGRTIKRVSARLKSFTPGRVLDETANVVAELDNGGIAVILASTISVGFKNEHGLRIFGSKGSLEWTLGSSRVLMVRHPQNGMRVYSLDANRSDFPPGVASYPLDTTLANLHTTMERAIRKKRGEKTPEPYGHPGATEGLAAMRFLQAAVESSKGGGAWTDVRAA